MSGQHDNPTGPAYAPVATAGTLSADGQWRWDGAAWQPEPAPRAHAGAHQPAQGRGLASWAGSLDEVTSEDLFYGQTVIVWARWILIAAGLLLSFWSPSSLTTLQIQLAAIIALAFGNFYLHVQLLRGHPSIDMVVYIASLADLVVVTALVVAQGGFTSPVFVFYFAAVLGFSVAFPTVLTAVYTLGAMGIYFLICVGTTTSDNLPEIFTRLLVLAAIAVCGNLFARNERALRDDAAEARAEAL